MRAFHHVVAGVRVLHRRPRQIEPGPRRLRVFGGYRDPVGFSRLRRERRLAAGIARHQPEALERISREHENLQVLGAGPECPPAVLRRLPPMPRGRCQGAEQLALLQGGAGVGAGVRPFGTVEAGRGLERVVGGRIAARDRQRERRGAGAARHAHDVLAALLGHEGCAPWRRRDALQARHAPPNVHVHAQVHIGRPPCDLTTRHFVEGRVGAQREVDGAGGCGRPAIPDRRRGPCGAGFENRLAGFGRGQQEIPGGQIGKLRGGGERIVGGPLDRRNVHVAVGQNRLGAPRRVPRRGGEAEARLARLTVQRKDVETNGRRFAGADLAHGQEVADGDFPASERPSPGIVQNVVAGRCRARRAVGVPALDPESHPRGDVSVRGQRERHLAPR